MIYTREIYQSDDCAGVEADPVAEGNDMWPPRPGALRAALRAWLPFVDTYRTLCLQQSAGFHELLADTGRLAPAQ
jgi:hypothetical protein